MEQQPEVEAAPIEAAHVEPSSSSELYAIDFMSEDEEVYQAEAAYDSRFDSSDDEDAPTTAAEQQGE